MLNAGIMTAEEFEIILNSKDICVCDFSASWCMPCRMMSPVMEDVSEKYKRKYLFYQIDIDSAEDLAEKYNVGSVPTLIVFKKGKEIGRTSGFMEMEEVEKFLNDTIRKTGE